MVCTITFWLVAILGPLKLTFWPLLEIIVLQTVAWDVIGPCWLFKLWANHETQTKLWVKRHTRDFAPNWTHIFFSFIWFILKNDLALDRCCFSFILPKQESWSIIEHIGAWQLSRQSLAIIGCKTAAQKSTHKIPPLLSYPSLAARLFWSNIYNSR